MKTKAEQLVEVAKWIKKQNNDFAKNFKTMRSIIKFYLQLPECYDKTKSVVAFINKNLNKDKKKWDSYIAHCKAEQLSVLANTLFECRYFENAPYKWTTKLWLRHYKYRNGNDCLDVVCTSQDRCSIYNDFKPQTMGDCYITIKTLGDAKRAADKLLADELRLKGKDLEVIYDDKLKEAIKQSSPTDEKLTESIDVVL